MLWENVLNVVTLGDSCLKVRDGYRFLFKYNVLANPNHSGKCKSTMEGHGGLVLLQPAIYRNLADRSYEKRKSAAVEIQKKVRELCNESNDGEADKIQDILNYLIEFFIQSHQGNYRKGGLIGLAAASIGLVKHLPRYLDIIVPPVVGLLKDSEARVRYYTCESLYNITKVARSDILKYFNEIFNGLCTLYMDNIDPEVRNGAQLLDRLMKDVVAETDTFDVNGFIPTLQDLVANKNPHVRQLLISWIMLLDTVPDIDMLEHLPTFLDGLFEFLEDPSNDIHAQAETALNEFLREIEGSIHVEYGRMVHILVDICKNTQRQSPCRLTALNWISEFIKLGLQKLAPFYPEMLEGILVCVPRNDNSNTIPIKNKADSTSEELLNLVSETAATTPNLDVRKLKEVLVDGLQSPWEDTRIVSLRWISMLLMKVPLQDLHINDIFPVLLKLLSDDSDQVVGNDLEVMARISANPDYFQLVLQNLLNSFSDPRDDLLAKRGKMIIERFAELLKGRKIYEELAVEVAELRELRFASLMVQTLNIILLTSPELFELREDIQRSLRGDGNEEDLDLFRTLFLTWCFDPIATLSLCLMAQAYELACALVFRFADLDLTVGFLMEVDKLVQLIESPIFVNLRLQLLEPQRHPFLLKTLYGLLMLLPQTPAFDCLRARLTCITGFGQLNIFPESKYALSQALPRNETEILDFESLLKHFDETQQRLKNLRRDEQSEKSYLKEKSFTRGEN